jgi:hypothetical protein
MSLMKTGRLHNDPYCFLAIEKDMLDREGGGPLGKLKLKLAGFTGRGAFGRLGRMFSGERGHG